MAIEKYDFLIKKYALKKGIPSDLLRRQIIKESSGNPKAIGDEGKSRGLMQIHEKTATDPKGIMKMKQADLPKLLQPEFNIIMGTNYLAWIRSFLGPLLPQNQTEAWGMIFMSYNSGPGYMKKSLERLHARGVEQPTLAQAVKEMQAPDFGRRPLFDITIPYAQFIMSKAGSIGEYVKGVASSVASVKPAKAALPVAALLLAGLGYYMYSQSQGKRVAA